MRSELHQWVARHNIPPQAAAELFALAGLAHVTVDRQWPVRKEEYGLGNDITQAVDGWGGSMWRNNSGVAREKDDKTGKVRQVRYGLGNISKAVNEVMKSSDRIGIAPGGLFLAVEIKPDGWTYSSRDERSVAQGNFLRRVNELGGIGTFATSVADVARAINQR